MRPDTASRRMLGIARSKAKMYEYQIPETFHIKIERDPSILFDLTIGILGSFCVDKENFIDESETGEDYTNLLFSAHYFSAIINSRLRESDSFYLRLLAASAYYLGGFPGTAKVVVGSATVGLPEAGGLESILHRLLSGTSESEESVSISASYKDIGSSILENSEAFLSSGSEYNRLDEDISGLKRIAYASNDRQLLLADVIAALVRKKIGRSVWNTIPRYSNIPVQQWAPALSKPNSITELWPSQDILGKRGLYSGSSAVVQMPTSAGKTRATELIIRSAFLSDRTKLAIIVAPYRALCNEIHMSFLKQFKNEGINVNIASDVMQEDVGFDFAAPTFSILILTPEKLDFLIRHYPELPERMGLVIFDEGHLLDDPSRGVKYELLLASLSLRLPEKAQVIFISAVLGNAGEISEWLLGSKEMHVDGAHLSPTYRTIAFVSWQETLGRLYFIDPEKRERIDFFVPRVLIQEELAPIPREKKQKYFPEKNDTSQISAYLACKLAPSGAVAIFVGKKDSAGTVARAAFYAFERGASIPSPRESADQQEIDILYNFSVRATGEESTFSLAAKHGILIHHGSVPHGLRLAYERAIQNGDVNVVICTSSLAQGVNLPIRYLIVTTDRQASSKIKTRDFHNLMGRAGRSGKHAEGTIIFANPAIFDGRQINTDRWRWNAAIALLDSKNSEPCKSPLLEALGDLPLLKTSIQIPGDRLWLVKLSYEDDASIQSSIEEIVSRFGDPDRRTEEEKNLEWKIKERKGIFDAAEAALIRYITEEGLSPDDYKDKLEKLVESTLAFFQAQMEEKDLVKEFFEFLIQRIFTTEPEIENLKRYSKSVLNLSQTKELESFIESQIEALTRLRTNTELLKFFLPLIVKYSSNRVLKALSNHARFSEISKMWVNGESLGEIYPLVSDAKVGNRKFTIEYLVDLFENGFGFEGTLIISTVTEIVKTRPDPDSELVERLNDFQKVFKYGLPNDQAVSFYEIGFHDRGLAIELSQTINVENLTRDGILYEIEQEAEAIRPVLNSYPRYFREVLESIL